MNIKLASTRIVNAILDDLSDRRGIGQELDSIDADVLRELRATLRGIVAKILKEQSDG